MPSLVMESSPKNARPVRRSPPRGPRRARRALRWSGLRGRVGEAKPLVEGLSEPGHDEERVVDPYADPDHRDEDRRDRVDVGQPGDDEQQDERRSDGHEASAIGIEVPTNVRKTIRSTRKAAMNPSSSWIPCWIGGDSASPLNSAVTPAGFTASRTASSTATTWDRSAVSIVSENCASAYAIRPFFGERPLRERVADALDPGLAFFDLYSGVLSFADGGKDCGLALGRVETLSGRCREHEVQHGALLGRELRLDEVGGLLRVRPRDLEHVLQCPRPR